jgi:hypothetical protein
LEHVMFQQQSSRARRLFAGQILPVVGLPTERDGGVVRQIRLAATVLTLGLVTWACGGSAPASQPPATASPPTSSSAQPSPAPAASPADLAQTVIDAALATMAEGTFRYDVEVRSADSDDTRPAISGRGQVSFGEPVQFRFSADGTSVLSNSADIIFDGVRAFFPAGATLPQNTWIVIDLDPPLAEVVRHSLLVRYGASALVLVAPLGATEARLTGEDKVRGITTRRFVAEVDISLAREHVPAVGLPAYESQLAAFEARGTALTHELEVWVDPQGRVVRTRYRQDVSSTAAIVVTYEFSDFGAPMDAAPPDGAEVLTVAEARERHGATPESQPPAP